MSFPANASSHEKRETLSELARNQANHKEAVVQVDNSQSAQKELILLDILKTYYELCRSREDRAPLVEVTGIYLLLIFVTPHSSGYFPAEDAY